MAMFNSYVKLPEGSGCFIVQLRVPFNNQQLIMSNFFRPRLDDDQQDLNSPTDQCPQCQTWKRKIHEHPSLKDVCFPLFSY